MKYLVRVKVPFGLHRKDDQLTVDLPFMEKFGRYVLTVAEIEEPEEDVQVPPKRKQKKGELVDVPLFEESTDVASGDLHSEGGPVLAKGDAAVGAKAGGQDAPGRQASGVN